MMRRIKKAEIRFAIVGIIFLVVLGTIIYDTYSTYSKTIITQQQEQLLTISKAVERSLKIYFNEQVINLVIISENNEFYKELLLKDDIDLEGESIRKNKEKFYQVSDFIALYVLDQEGDVKYHSIKSEYQKDYMFETKHLIHKPNQKEAKIGEAYPVLEHNYAVNISVPIYNNDEYMGALIGILDVKDIYNKVVKDTKVGEKGYVMVKDATGVIIMHPMKEQIGKRIIEDRKKEFPNLDYTDLKKLTEKQYEQGEGVAEYYSYWWYEKLPQRIKKISSFCHVEIGKSFWVLAAVMDYKEITRPIHDNVMRLMELTATIIIIILGTIILIIRFRKREQELLKETKYLKNMSYTLQELQEKEKQVRHYEKLKTIGTLTGGIAHEFNNLLTPILGYSQLAIVSMDEKDELYEDMNEIYSSAIKAKELVQQIMLFSRRDKMEANRKILNVREQILSGLKLVKMSKNVNVELEVQIAEECGYIYANETQFQQVIINLCNNGNQAMKEKGGKLIVRVEKISGQLLKNIKTNKMDKREYVCLSVTDNGCGMNEKVIERIFDPFFTTKAKGEGTGVGLSVVQGIVYNHKGDIIVESEEGKGSAFKVYLPTCDKEKLEKREKEYTPISMRKISILLVEDEVRVSKLLKKSLTSMGYEVKAYTDANKAIEGFKQNPMKYDLVITDYAMPHLTGTEFAKLIREIRYNIKIMLITGLVEREVLKKVEEQVIDKLIIKPIDYHELNKTIQENVK